MYNVPITTPQHFELPCNRLHHSDYIIVNCTNACYELVQLGLGLGLGLGTVQQHDNDVI